MREVRIGHCIDLLREMEPCSIQCVVTSPPYLGLRRYEGHQKVVWGGDPDCQHEWVEHRYYTGKSAGRGSGEAFHEAGPANAERLKAARWREDSTCAKCGAWYGAFGLEPTPELYVEHTISILREIHRVLRPDGVLWWNIGDSFFGSWGNYGARAGKQRTRREQRFPRAAWDANTKRPPLSGNHHVLKPKDLCAIPFRVALAAQADGWWLRSVVIWQKLNGLPESVKDRPTVSHEYILLLTKSQRYFYDADAVREPHLPASIERAQRRWATRSKYDGKGPEHQHSWVRDKSSMRQSCHPAGRNLRSIWPMATRPYPGAHFAVFPPELPRRCILAGTPEKACATCGAPWQRVTRREIDNTGYPHGPGGNYAGKGRPPGGQESDQSSTLGKVARYRVITVGWQPTCQCHGEPDTVTVKCERCAGTGRELAYPDTGPNTADRNKAPYQKNNPHLARLDRQPTDEPCPACAGTGECETTVWPHDVLQRWPTRPAIVLDPFAGSGTTLMVAEELGRWWIGLDICEDYRSQILERTRLGEQAGQRSLTGGDVSAAQ
jgi:DNA modification methylase